MRLALALLLCCCTVLVAAQHKKEKVYTGKIRVLEFSARAGMRDWFLKEYRAYEPTDSLLKNINNYLTGKQLVLVFGSWCSDSKREVPRWIKVLNRSGFSMENMKVYGVSRNKKQPVGVAKKYGITKVPTLIVYQNGTEVNRITETPNVSFEHDLLN